MKKVHDYLLKCGQDRIEDVENKKRARELDRLIAKKTLRLYRQNGKYSTDKQIKNTTEKIRLHLNVLIVSIALSKTAEEAINLANAHKILGRHVLGKKVKKLPDDTVLQIKEIVSSVNKQYALTKENRDKIMVRVKTRHISRVISELVSRYGYDFPWPEIDVENNGLEE